MRRRQKKMAQRRMCDVCGVRPAVVTVRRIVPGEPPRIEHLCEVHAAEARRAGGRSPLGGSPLGGGGGSLFDDFFGRFFDGEPFGETRRGGAVPRRQAEQVDITQSFPTLRASSCSGRPSRPSNGAAST